MVVFCLQFSVTETIMTSIVDQFPHALDSQKKVTILRLIVMLSSCILAVPLYSGVCEYTYVLSVVNNRNSINV